jgi:phosphomannomutase
MKELVDFDMDGTLAASKSSIDAEIGRLLESLLAVVKVAVISGGAWQQFVAHETISAPVPIAPSATGHGAVGSHQISIAVS